MKELKLDVPYTAPPKLRISKDEFTRQIISWGSPYSIETWKGLRSIRGKMLGRSHWFFPRGTTNHKSSWVKRFAKYMRDEYNYKITPDDAGLIGSRMEALLNSEQYVFEISNFGGWKAGSFKESASSCWWSGGDLSVKNRFINEGGLSILLYRNLQEYERYRKIQGLGRCWMVKIDTTKYIIFNAYGKKLSVFANLLSQALEMRHKKIVLMDLGSYYVNGGRGIIITNKIYQNNYIYL